MILLNITVNHSFSSSRTMFIWFPDSTPTAGLVKSRINITQIIAKQVKNQAHIRRYFPTSKKKLTWFSGRKRLIAHLSIVSYCIHSLIPNDKIRQPQSRIDWGSPALIGYVIFLEWFLGRIPVSY